MVMNHFESFSGNAAKSQKGKEENVEKATRENEALHHIQ